jgi:5-methylcytosine-specific restriction endonuclease McrA
LRRATCGHCGCEFESIKPRIYCTKACTRKAMDAKKQKRARISRVAIPVKRCSQCSADFHPASVHHTKFCTPACKKRWHNDALLKPARDAAAVRQQQRQVAALLRLRATQEKQEAKANRKAAEAIAKAMLANRSCEDCGCQVGSARHLCPQCAKQRARRQKAISRDARKAMLRVASVESVDPIKVFERAGWKCYLCGCPTPKELRGTYESNAPELEHVMPLSKGGAHSYANTDCACRACNLEKSDLTLDELLA